MELNPKTVKTEYNDVMLFLKVGAPFIAIFLTSVIAWVWSNFNIGIYIGSLPLPSVLVLSSIVIMGVFAISKRLPLSLIVWPPAGLSSLFILTTGLISTEFDPAVGILSAIVYVLTYLFVLLVAIKLMGRSLSLSFCYILIFIISHSMRFPYFELGPELTHSNLVTALSATRSLIEVVLATLIIRSFLLRDFSRNTKFAWYLFVLALSHGITASWEGPLIAGSLSFATSVSQTLRWMGLLLLQLGFVLAVYRMRRAYDFFATVEYVPPNDDDNKAK